MKIKQKNMFFKILSVVIFFFLFTNLIIVEAAEPTLFFSEYLEGSGNNKALEIFNPTCNDIQLADEGYKILMYFNGNTTSSLTVNLTGVIPSRGTYVIATNTSDSNILQRANQTNNSSWFNGDDAIVLMKNSEVIDVFGKVGEDPGTSWGDPGAKTHDRTLVRKSNIVAGNTDIYADFHPSDEWIFYPIDTYVNLGSHEYNSFTITFDLMGKGEVVSGNLIQELYYGDEIIAPVIKPLNGFNFISWSSVFSTVTGNTTIEAQYGSWTKPSVYFSKYVEGSNNNKALEIYNATSSSIDLSLEEYKVLIYFNGNTNPTTTINLNGILAPGETFVLAQNTSNSTLLAYANQTSSLNWFNGNDAVVLTKNGDVLDRIGQVGNNPGNEWGKGMVTTMDKTLVRKSFVSEGDKNTTSLFFPEIQWESYPIDTFNVLGTHISEYFKVTFNISSLGTVESGEVFQTLYSGMSAIAPSVNAVETHDFNGWDKSFDSISGDIIVNALYSPKIFTIIFNTDGGSNIEPIIQGYGSAIVLPASPTKEGFNFIDWDDSFPDTMPLNGLTLNAIWEAKEYTITFDTKGGSAINPIVAPYQSNITIPEDPTKEGYKFLGWDISFPDTMPLNGLNLTALWEDLNKDTPNTIDNFNIIIYFGMLILSAIAFVVTYKKIKFSKR